MDDQLDTLASPPTLHVASVALVAELFGTCCRSALLPLCCALSGVGVLSDASLARLVSMTCSLTLGFFDLRTSGTRRPLFPRTSPSLARPVSCIGGILDAALACRWFAEPSLFAGLDPSWQSTLEWGLHQPCFVPVASSSRRMLFWFFAGVSPHY